MSSERLRTAHGKLSVTDLTLCLICRQNRLGVASAEAIARQNAEEASFSAFGQLAQTQNVSSQPKRSPPFSTLKELMLGNNSIAVCLLGSISVPLARWFMRMQHITTLSECTLVLHAFCSLCIY